jgi:3-oxoadipate enol-lactonase
MSHAVINGARLWYEVRGTGAPLLLHHGYTASRVNWAPVAERLQDRYQVILMESRGTGESEHTERGYSLEQYAADVVGLLDHLNLPRVTYAGHSMGGGIGYRLALDHAERLERLILMAPIPADGIGPIDPEMRAARLEERRRKDRAALLARYQAMRFREDVETDAWFDDRVRHILGVSDGHFEQSAESMTALAVGSRLGEIHTPTLMIAGAVDGLLLANLADFQRLPNATLEVLSRAGHEVAVHEPDRVAAAIDVFMQHGVVTAASLMARAMVAASASA